MQMHCLNVIILFLNPELTLKQNFSCEEGVFKGKRKYSETGQTS